jgi:hypothetical protein
MASKESIPLQDATGRPQQAARILAEHIQLEEFWLLCGRDLQAPDKSYGNGMSWPKACFIYTTKGMARYNQVSFGIHPSYDRTGHGPELTPISAVRCLESAGMMRVFEQCAIALLRITRHYDHPTYYFVVTKGNPISRHVQTSENQGLHRG